MNLSRKFKFYSWNVRGLNDKEKRIWVKHAILKEAPTLVCLQETKWQEEQPQIIREALGPTLRNYVIIPACNTAGGVIVAWDNSILTEVEHIVGKYCLNIDFMINQDTSVFRFTGLYGPSTQRGRGSFYRELRQAKPQMEMPWLVAGDFNVTLNWEDRSNVNYPIQHMRGFRAVVNQLELMDVMLQGRQYTWSNEREVPTFVRLDRYMMSTAWVEQYPNTTLRAASENVSDHCPLICEIQTKFPVPNVFRMENSWLKVESFLLLVERTWAQHQIAADPISFAKKMEHLTKEIIVWKKKYKKVFGYQQKVCLECIGWLTVQSERRQLTVIEKLLQALITVRYKEIMLMQEEKWRQRAKRTWIELGDRNTKYFHQMATLRKRRSWISVVQEGQIQAIEHKQKANIFFRHFVALVGQNHNQTMAFDYQGLYDRNEEQLQQLCQPITVEEIEQTIDQMPSNKAPGPDGYTCEFYKKFKRMLIPDLLRVCNSLIQGQCSTLYPLNDSFIALIPKKTEAITPGDFRPISLINSVQKLFSKIMAERIKPMMNSLISPNQTGFLQDRFINEGFLYAQELVTLATKQKKQVGIFKADIFKAFDTLSWEFLAQILQARGFPAQWILWIKHGVLQGSSRVLVNSVAGKKILLRRGLRQGDPLSPYLFILAMDFLAIWTEKLVNLNMLKAPFPGCKQCILFADDTLFILQPQPQQLQFLKIILYIFHDLSGLAVNLEKSEFLVTSSNQQIVQNLAQTMGCKPAEFPITYLGMPLSNKKLNKAHFMPLIQKIENRLPKWKAAMLSLGGRLTLVNAVMSAIPIYMMQTFMLPKWVVKRIDQVRRKFLWSGNKQHDKRYMSLIAWEIVIKPRSLGGLGVMNMDTMNKALMGKIMYKWLQINRPSWMSIVQLNHQVTRPWELDGTTRFWAAIKQIAPFMSISVKFSKGDGVHIKFWSDHWLEQGPIRQKYPCLYEYAQMKEMAVHQAYINGNWDLKLNTVMDQTAQGEKMQLLAKLNSLPESQDQQDTVTWRWEKSGCFSVKSFYRALERGPLIREEVSNIWKIKGPLRVMIFGWLMLRNRILTVDNLVARGWAMVNMCIICKKDSETVKHLFGDCQTANQIRLQILVQHAEASQCSFFSNGKFRKALLNSQKMAVRRLQLVFCFVIWRERCRRIFQEKFKTVTLLTSEIMVECGSWYQQE